MGDFLLSLRIGNLSEIAADEWVGIPTHHFRVSASWWQWAAENKDCAMACQPAACSLQELNAARSPHTTALQASTTDAFDFFDKLIPTALLKKCKT